MIVYKLQGEIKEKYETMLAKRKDIERAFDIMEELTGIRPDFVSDTGSFAFKKKGMMPEDLPPFLKMNKRTDFITPKKSTRKGREILKRFAEDYEPLPSVHPFHICQTMGIPFGSGFNIETVNGEPCFVSWSGFDPEELGCEKLEI